MTKAGVSACLRLVSQTPEFCLIGAGHTQACQVVKVNVLATTGQASHLSSWVAAGSIEIDVLDGMGASATGQGYPRAGF